ncbi:MAG: RluA family pseudouridine synthase [Tannerella sp.]|jgi:23S rRNA pseudouridine1911/1915/1917 synthase|nr:RluA family pseudouridine synthase [Tannerella sp.]
MTVNEQNTLLPFLFERLKEQSRTSVKSLLKYGRVKVNGKSVTKFDLPLQQGDIVEISAERENNSQFYHPLMKIIWMDADLVVIYKAEGLLSVSGSPAQKYSAYSILLNYLESLHPRNKLYILHRLDKGTSGVMMFARTLEAQQILRGDWSNMITERTYVAVTEGHPPRVEDTVVTYLSENRRQRVYCTDPGNGKEAISHYRVIAGNGQYSLLELTLETGRKNQIRVQMEFLGCPVAGDRKYNAKTDPCGRLMLHAKTLRFIHPITGEEMNFEYPPPKEFYELCDKI